MPVPFNVDIHPKKKQIIAALIARRPYAEIKRRYGITVSSLNRYMRGVLLKRAAEVEAKDSLATGEQVLERVKMVMHRIQKLLDACDEYLTDPEDPTKYELGPRATDIQVIYYEPARDGKGRAKSIRRSRSLQGLISQVMKGLGVKQVISMQYRHADPRKLIIDAADTLTKQLEMIAKIYGQIQDVTINIANVEHWTDLKAIILEATQDAPDVRERIVNGLARITGE